MSSLELPDVEQSDLDRQTVIDLVAQIATCEVLEVRSKGHGRAVVSDIDSALDDLLSGRSRGLQLVYRHDGETWMDTVMSTAGGYRVVRMATPWGATR